MFYSSVCGCIVVLCNIHLVKCSLMMFTKHRRFMLIIQLWFVCKSSHNAFHLLWTCQFSPDWPAVDAELCCRLSD